MFDFLNNNLYTNKNMEKKMKKQLLLNIFICLLCFTGFISSCNKHKLICEKCIDKKAHACHKGLCRMILSKEEIEKTDKEYEEHIKKDI